MSTLISLRTEESLVEELDQLAASLDRNRTWVINEAIRNYLELHAWQVEHVKKGMADADAGRTISQEQVMNRIVELHKNTKAAKTKSRTR